MWNPWKIHWALALVKGLREPQQWENYKRIPAQEVDWFRTIPDVPKHLLSNPCVWRITACSARWTLIHQPWERKGTRYIHSDSFRPRMNHDIDNLFLFWPAVIWSIACEINQLTWLGWSLHLPRNVLYSTGDGKEQVLHMIPSYNVTHWLSLTSIGRHRPLWSN